MEDDELKYNLRQSFARPAYSVLCSVGKSVLVMKEILWKNNLYFVRDVLITYVNFIRTAIIAIEEKQKALLS